MLALTFLQPCCEQGREIDPAETQCDKTPFLQHARKKAGISRWACEVDGVVFQTDCEVTP